MAGPTPEKPIEVFVVSPIGAAGSDVRKRADDLLKHVIRKALPVPTYRVLRGDEDDAPDAITRRVIREIIGAELVIADLTGHNPNVFYELAIAHGFQKPVVHLSEGGERPPFDVQDMRVIPYTLDLDGAEEATAAVKASADRALRNPNDLHTPLTGAERFIALRGGDGSPEGTGEALADTLEEMVDRLRGIERSIEALTHSAPASMRSADPGPSRTQALIRALEARSRSCDSPTPEPGRRRHASASPEPRRGWRTLSRQSRVRSAWATGSDFRRCVRPRRASPRNAIQLKASSSGLSRARR